MNRPGRIRGDSQDPELQLKDSWSVNAMAWTDAVRSRAIASRALATDAAIVDAVMACRPRRVLDVGTGEGWLAHRLAEQQVEVVGFDASEELVRKARAGGAGSFHALDYEALVHDPQQLGSDFDVAVCNFSLLGRDITGLLRALARVLAVDGKLIIQTVHPFSGTEGESYRDGWREEDFRGMGDGFRASMPWYFRTIGSWIRVLREAGFLIRESREPVHPETGKPLSLLWIASRDH